MLPLELKLRGRHTTSKTPIGRNFETLDPLLPDSLQLESPLDLNDNAIIVAEAVYIAQEYTVPKINHRLGRPYSISSTTLQKIQERGRLRRKLHRHGNSDFRPVIKGLNKEIRALLALDKDVIGTNSVPIWMERPTPKSSGNSSRGSAVLL